MNNFNCKRPAANDTQ